MAVRYGNFTPARAAALKKAQAASAAKRRGRGRGKLAAANRSNSRLKKGLKYAVIGAGGAAAAGYVYAGHRAVKKSNAANAHYNATSTGSRDFADAHKRVKHINFGISKRSIAKAKIKKAAKGTSGTVTHAMGHTKRRGKGPSNSSKNLRVNVHYPQRVFHSGASGTTVKRPGAGKPRGKRRK